MLGDGTMDSWRRKVWPHGARRGKSPANDALFIDVVADFSRKLGERVARQSAGGLAGAAQERREALKAYHRDVHRDRDNAREALWQARQFASSVPDTLQRDPGAVSAPVGSPAPPMLSLSGRGAPGSPAPAP